MNNFKTKLYKASGAAELKQSANTACLQSSSLCSIQELNLILKDSHNTALF